MTEEAALAIVLSCDRPDDIVRAVNRVVPTLPTDIRRRLNIAKLHYLAAENIRGLFDRVNGRTVAQVLAEFDAQYDPQVVAVGERDGVKFTLYDPPASR